MSAVRELIAMSVHRWLTSTLAVCAGHPADPDDLPPECERLADRIIGDLGWPEAGP